ncbi:hypothetical protein MKS88_004505 [Plasmodium brasilianum]|uniref:Uncharacterized protein n=2 Tax=Plasmodium (Plasmodium) TaxID=418103 RepID=A0A1C3L1D3_PLAMA|nr:conserved Plasmodium protein, unknown function [Plasmodium malariae]KAI4836703.1 hypothetical protein MKS88_004505 [Plasmodium brasilianum]SBT80354.1 conserved Plasmodium protein, unknown function [Plasmodium malariae]SCO93990.1 conserved Plasmodium protein, unknown function [Plasmodium malariae]
MKKISLLVNELKHVFKKKSNNLDQSSILKNIKIQNIYSNDKINKKEHYIYFKEYDIKTNNFNYTHVIKTKKLFKNGFGKYKNGVVITTIGCTIGMILSVFFLSSKWNIY